MSAERVYALLVEANPIPDPDMLPEPGPRLVDERSPTMQVDTVQQRQPVTPRSRRRLAPLLAAVAAMVVAGTAVALISSGGDEAGSREAGAVAIVEEFYAALRSGDLPTIERLTNGDEAEMRMWGFNVVRDAAHPRDAVGCEAVDSANSLFVAVECTVNLTDPLSAASGVTQWVEPWQVFDGGDVRWRPIEEAALGSALRSARDYLRSERPDEYSEVCDPSNYAFGEIIFNEGIALTPECAGLLVSYTEEIAAGIETGR